MERVLRIPFVPDEIRLIMTCNVGYADVLDRHGARTALLASRIATTMNLEESEMEILISASYLHDIGKMFIPRSILDKPSRLTTEEFDQIKKHPETGRIALAGFIAYERIAIIVGQHHERMDGRGYPHRRPGDKIDPLARILSVADAFCAMTEERPYQGPLPTITAIGRIHNCAGSQFDLQVVDAFLESDLNVPTYDDIIILRGETQIKNHVESVLVGLETTKEMLEPSVMVA